MSEVIHKFGPLVLLLLLLLLESCLLHGLGTRLGLLLEYAGVDQLKVAVISCNPRWRGRFVGRSACDMVGVVRSSGVVEDEGPVAMDRLRNTVPCTPGRGIRMVTTIVAATSRGCIFTNKSKSHPSNELFLFWHDVHRKGPGLVGVAGARPACWFFARLIWPVTTRQK